MNILILLILCVFVLVGIVSLIVLISIKIKTRKYMASVKVCLKNKLQCEQYKCPRKITNLPVPEQNDTKYNSAVIRYLADLIVRVENAVTGQLLPPENLKEEMKIYNIEKSPLFGMLWSNNDNNRIVYIVFRGTINSEEWIQDFNYNQDVFQKNEKVKQQRAMFLRNTEVFPHVHNGFLNVYNNFREKLVSKLQELNPTQILLSGHSLGAGVSTICGLDLKLMGYNTIVYNFASPRVGDDNLCNLIKTSNLPVYRLVNTCDVVPTLPPSVSPNLEDPNNPYIYTHCGQGVYFTSNWKSIINNHLMGIYLEALDSQ